jgi:predicted phosphodiesterase
MRRLTAARLDAARSAADHAGMTTSPAVTAILSSLPTGRPLRVGLVSDIHGQHKRDAVELFCLQASPDLLLCAGDLQDYRGGYPAPMLFIRGNHECWAVLDEMDAGTRTPPGLARLADGSVTAIGGVRVAAAGGAWPRSPGQERRSHLTASVAARLAALAADVVISHDTPTGFPDRPEFAIAPLRAALDAVAPALWLSGHHHHWHDGTADGTRVVSLGRWPDDWAVAEFGGGRILRLDRFEPRSSGYGKRKARWMQDEQQEKSLLLPLDRKGRRYGVTEPGVPAL